MNRQSGTLLAAILGSGLVFLDSTVVGIALPRMGRDLPSGVLGVLEAQSYVYNGYLLTLSALLILAGALSDVYGRRRMFAIGLVGFSASSVLCGLAPSFEALVVFRMLQGAMGALLVPGSLALITATFEGEQQGRAFGIWAGASGATTILGPLVGGLLVDSVSWRAVFLINLPLVLPALWAVWRHVEESRDEDASPVFDWRGAAVVALAVGGLAFGAIYGQQREWRDPVAYVALAVGALATAAFVPLMARTEHPLVPLSLFASRNFAVTNLSTFLIYGALYVSLYCLGLFLQGTLGYSAASAGLAGIPGSLLLVLFSSRFGALAGRYGPRRFMTAGPILMALGLLWLARVPADSAAWALRPEDPTSYLPPVSYLLDFLPGQLVYGIGLTILVAPLTTALMTSVPVQRAGVGSAINNAISRVGPQLAGALVFVAITATFYGALAARVPGLDVAAPELRTAVAPLNAPGPGAPPAVASAARPASQEAFRLAMEISAVLLVAGAIANGLGIRDDVVARRRDDAPEQAPGQPALAAD